MHHHHQDFKCSACRGPLSREKPGGYFVCIKYDSFNNKYQYHTTNAFCSQSCVQETIHSNRKYNPDMLAVLNYNHYKTIHVSDASKNSVVVPTSDPDLLVNVRGTSGLSLDELHNLSRQGFRIRSVYLGLHIGPPIPLVNDNVNQLSLSSSSSPMVPTPFVLPTNNSPSSNLKECSNCRHGGFVEGIPVAIGENLQTHKYIIADEIRFCSPECLFFKVNNNRKYNPHELCPLNIKMLFEVYGIREPIKMSIDPDYLYDVCLDPEVCYTIDQFRQHSHLNLTPIVDELPFEIEHIKCVKQYVLNSTETDKQHPLTFKSSVSSSSSKRVPVVYHLTSQIPMDEHKQQDPCMLQPNHFPLFPPSVMETWSSVQSATQPFRQSIGNQPTPESVLLSCFQ